MTTQSNGLTPEERKAYTTNCQQCQNPLLNCVCASGPTFPDPQHAVDPIYNYMQEKMATPDRCHECHQLIGSDPTADDEPTTTHHHLTTSPGIKL
jgi:hypothetical protein